VIGILSLPLEYTPYTVNGTSYISASYVKWAQSGGARVVPLLVNSTQEELAEVVPHLNGVLLTGGSAPIFEDNSSELSPYAITGCLILDLVRQLNDAGHYFPIWATCLGHELLHVCIRPLNDTLGNFAGEPSYSHFVNFTSNAYHSRLMGNPQGSQVIRLFHQDIAFFSHENGISPATYGNSSLSDFFSIVGIGYDHNNTAYVALTEAKHYPVYTSQFHPEKNRFEWNLEQDIPHSPPAVLMSTYFANFFISEARRNSLHFASEAVLKGRLIENTPPYYLDANFEQIYVF
jgi:gamma-glutamyl hydrolase